MHFTTLALAALLSLASAAPIAPEEKRWPSKPNLIKPKIISEYYVKSGRIDYNVPNGHIHKDPSNGGDDRTTLVTFDIPTAAAGQTCHLGLWLNGADSTIAGSQLVDIYTSLAPAPGSRSGWGPGNQRNNHVGRVKVNDGGDAVFQDGYPKTVQSFACPLAGQWPVELVGVYDYDEITWGTSNSGAYLWY